MPFQFFEYFAGQNYAEIRKTCAIVIQNTPDANLRAGHGFRILRRIGKAVYAERVSHNAETVIGRLDATTGQGEFSDRKNGSAQLSGANRL